MGIFSKKAQNSQEIRTPEEKVENKRNRNRTLFLLGLTAMSVASMQVSRFNGEQMAFDVASTDKRIPQAVRTEYAIKSTEAEDASTPYVVVIIGGLAVMSGLLIEAGFRNRQLEDPQNEVVQPAEVGDEPKA